MSSQSDAKSRPRSRLTQSLLDAKEQSTEEPSKQTNSTRTEESSKSSDLASNSKTLLVEKHDDTIDLEYPRSQSGQYWKTEFENYRKRTNLEISKLIQYRSSARSFARKKDVEAMRLREELRKEEEKVANMERRVTELALTMMSEKVDDERERLVHDLTRQTALAVQYKHKVDTLRKTLERHGVIGSPDEQTDSDESARDNQLEISKLKEALEDANRKLKERNQDDDIKKLQNLAISSERKVSELEKENAALKRTITRVKDEMGKYEERRTEKEAKLKLRIESLDLKCSKYKQKMKQYGVAVQEERNIYRQEIEALKEELASLSPSRRRVSLDDLPHRLQEKSYAGIHVHDFGGDGNTRNPLDKDDEMLQVSNVPSKDVACDSWPDFTDNPKHRRSGLSKSRRLVNSNTYPKRIEQNSLLAVKEDTLRASFPPAFPIPFTNSRPQHSRSPTKASRRLPQKDDEKENFHDIFT
jgi:hypothetical protein